MSEISEKTIVAHEQTLNAMANVNAVDGFDPCLVTACYRDEEGKSRMYLQAEPAMLWFRLKHPNGRLEQVLTRSIQARRISISMAPCLVTPRNSLTASTMRS